MNPTPIAREVWAVEDALRLPGGVVFPLRCTIVRLPDGGLWLHSPVAFDDTTAAAVEALGPVAHLVAPSAMHHLHLGDAQARWPDATTWAPEALRAKRPDLALPHTLDEAAPWDDVVQRIALDGAPRIAETLFLHRPTGTLLCTDLVFHVTRPATLASRLMYWLVGTSRGPRMSRSWHLLADDLGAMGTSLAPLLDGRVERLVPCHGDVVDPAPPEVLRRAWSRALTRARALTG